MPDGVGQTDGVGSASDASDRKPERTVDDVLRGKKGSIKRAPLPPDSPSWDEVLDLPLSELERRADANEPGYRTIRKLLKDKRFDR